jgi:hypothetical protein
LQIGVEPQLPEQFEFKCKNQLRRRLLPAEAIEKSAQQFKHAGQRRFHFRRLLDERGGIGDLAQFQKVPPDCAMHFAQNGFA